MESWLEQVSVQPGRVAFEGHNDFLETGDVVVVPSELRFRTQAEWTRPLSDHGLAIEHLYGDWQRGLVTPKSRFMVFVVRRL